MDLFAVAGPYKDSFIIFIRLYFCGSRRYILFARFVEIKTGRAICGERYASFFVGLGNFVCVYFRSEARAFHRVCAERVSLLASFPDCGDQCLRSFRPLHTFAEKPGLEKEGQNYYSCHDASDFVSVCMGGAMCVQLFAG